MKDLHSHLLYGIDDGSKSLEESITLIKRASDNGVKAIMLTPHYIENSIYNCNNEEKKRILEELKNEVKRKNIDIELYLGNEVYFTNNFIDLLMEKEITTLNNSKYLLFELPLINVINNALDTLYELIRIGCVPILAHPERYLVFQKHPDLIKEYLEVGILLQGNYESLFGRYGPDAEKLLTYYLKNDWITFLGSDCHHHEHFDIEQVKNKLKKIIDDDKINDLLENNFDVVVNDGDFEKKNNF